MHRIASVLVAALLAVAILAGPALGQDPNAGPAFGAKVQDMIDRTVEFLWANQQEDGSWGDYPHEEGRLGLCALVTYALLESGASPQDPRMAKAITFLESQKATITYALGLRANVWHVANRTTADKYLKHLRSDMNGLNQIGGKTGRFHYKAGQAGWDNSNGQYGVLGMWAGAQNGVDTRQAFWSATLSHWKGNQNPDGGWGYSLGAGYAGWFRKSTQATMSVGGLATLYVCIDNLPTPSNVKRCQDVQMDASVRRAHDWMDNQFRQTLFQPHPFTAMWYLYYMYGVERAALASGYKYFGGMDWYKSGIERLAAIQQDDSTYFFGGQAKFEGGGVVQIGDPGALGKPTHITNSAFALLFLIRGQQPLLFNKLQFDGAWNNRPREMAAVTRWLSKTFEEDVNWQILPIEKPVSEWRDAPFLYISSHQQLPVGAAGAVVIPGADQGAPPEPTTFNDENIAKIQEYVYKGGTVLTVTEANGAPFKTSVRTLYKKLFPKYELTECPPGHDLYNLHYKLDPKLVKFYIVSNGVRPLGIHTDMDLSLVWQEREWNKQKWAFEAAANIALYTIDSLGRLPARGTNTWLSAPDIPALGDVPTGGVQVTGGPPPEEGPVDLIIFGAGLIATGDQAGQTVTLGDGSTATVPIPNSAGRVTVIHPQTQQRINIPEELLGRKISAPQIPPFTPQRPGKAQEGGGTTAPAVPTTSAPPGGAATLVRLKHSGNYDPEPRAYERFAYLMQDRADTAVTVLGPVGIDQLANQDAKLAVLTTTDKLELTDAEIKALETFMDGGGTLFIDVAGGASKEVQEDFKRNLFRNKFFAGQNLTLRELAQSSPIYKIPGAEINRVKYRRTTQLELSRATPNLEAVIKNDRPVVIYSAQDVTGGLVGYPSYAVDGYEPVSAFAILRNVVLYAGR